ncbi:cell surface protein [Polaribacter litorisediminis]|uniref:tetratricopeptide repeat protein n=1 Tax=Polaribacter litorisediminis TaxID=1908341 RepID=UPI001CBFFE28|nr:cell surface protein [Polaribacter litorisediminis]UAM99511.1 cell surface protein [Polaribacter litorisediminis]
MKYIQLILIFVTISITISCNNHKTKQITNSKDYNSFLNLTENTSLKNAINDLNFWGNKLKQAPSQYPYHSKIAAANSNIFKLTGNIQQLKEAEKNLITANEKTNYNNTGYLRSLATNYISQHRFQEALELLTKAEFIGEKLQQTHLMLIDVYLELGNLQKVEEYLSKVQNFKDFDYLIRVSKYNDHIGNLDKAIVYLEKSLDIATSSKNKNLMQWNYTNLADYYGHAGRIKESYNAYLKALSINPNNTYAKKGIAWIVYSYERNPKEALRILETVSRENAGPESHLLKAEIADFMGNRNEQEKQITLYKSKVTNQNYGAMYAKYNVLLFAEDDSNQSKAIAIAKQEVASRPTAQSYDLLAWSFFKNGNHKKAMQIVKNHVIGKTFEPEALLHTAYILKANGKHTEAKKLKTELLGAIYELGPNSEQEIHTI